jgi:hypothetical protein
MSDTELKITDILALDRTRMASERTLMAWVRTALSMISFGFTIWSTPGTSSRAFLGMFYTCHKSLYKEIIISGTFLGLYDQSPIDIVFTFFYSVNQSFISLSTKPRGEGCLW